MRKQFVGFFAHDLIGRCYFCSRVLSFPYATVIGSIINLLFIYFHIRLSLQSGHRQSSCVGEREREGGEAGERVLLWRWSTQTTNFESLVIFDVISVIFFSRLEHFEHGQKKLVSFFSPAVEIYANSFVVLFFPLILFCFLFYSCVLCAYQMDFKHATPHIEWAENENPLSNVFMALIRRYSFETLWPQTRRRQRRMMKKKKQKKNSMLCLQTHEMNGSYALAFLDRPMNTHFGL